MHFILSSSYFVHELEHQMPLHEYLPLKTSASIPPRFISVTHSTEHIHILIGIWTSFSQNYHIILSAFIILVILHPDYFSLSCYWDIKAIVN